MIYRAKVRFVDLQDGKWLYNAGDTFPRKGLHVTPERIAQLAGSDNRSGYPLIEPISSPVEVAESKPEEVIEMTHRIAEKGNGAAKRARRKKASGDA